MNSELIGTKRTRTHASAQKIQGADTNGYEEFGQKKRVKVSDGRQISEVEAGCDTNDNGSLQQKVNELVVEGPRFEVTKPGIGVSQRQGKALFQ